MLCMKKGTPKLELDEKGGKEQRGRLNDVKGGWSLKCWNGKALLVKNIPWYGFKIACVSGISWWAIGHHKLKLISSCIYNYPCKFTVRTLIGKQYFQMCFIIYNKAFVPFALWPTLHIFIFVLTGLIVKINMTFLGWRQQIKPNKTHVAPKCPVSKGFSKVLSSCSYFGLL